MTISLFAIRCWLAGWLAGIRIEWILRKGLVCLFFCTKCLAFTIWRVKLLAVSYVKGLGEMNRLKENTRGNGKGQRGQKKYGKLLKLPYFHHLLIITAKRGLNRWRVAKNLSHLITSKFKPWKKQVQYGMVHCRNNNYCYNGISSGNLALGVLPYMGCIGKCCREGYGFKQFSPCCRV